jgi:flagellar motor switch protein FliM
MSSAAEAKPKHRTIHSCNFRYAGRLSNENARALTALHEKFALNVTTSLELYLGTSLELKLVSLEQMAISDYITSMAGGGFLLPCSLNVMQSTCVLDLDIALVFPMIDLLLGGAGTPADVIRDITEIDEEIMQSVTGLLVSQIQASWRALNITLTPSRCIKPGVLQQVFQANEKLVLLMFQMTIGETTGLFRLVLPTSFVGFLLRNLKAVESKKLSSFRSDRKPALRERILDCDFVVAADITHMRVLVKDLIDMRPGAVLKMKAPVKRPGRLTVDHAEIFEALPVRNGLRKAAQLTARSQEPDGKKEQI